MQRPLLRHVDGILLLNKPLHLTSNAALQRVKRLFSAKKAGHTGSLDPLATGMLPLCLGEATKFSQFLLESSKTYEVVGKLGMNTTTGDAEGEVIRTRAVANLTLGEIEKVLSRFKGGITQVPPMYSALKHQGQPLYVLARKGVAVERPARAVTIHALTLLDYQDDQFRLFVHCSKGTYIRTLVEDMGEALGCGAFVLSLHRRAVTPYQEAGMYTLNTLEAIHEQQGVAGLLACLLPMETAIQTLPTVTVSAAAVFYLKMGQSVTISPDYVLGDVQLMTQEGQFLGIGEVLPGARVTPKRLVVKK